MELKEGKAQVRDMATAQQQPVPIDEVPDHVKRLQANTLAETNV
jgi:histidyl-tRNA synthetase